MLGLNNLNVRGKTMSEAQKYIDAIKSGELTIFQKMALCVNEVKKGNKIEVACKLGLWSVIGNESDVYFDALHYFKQYMDDGEYSSIIGGKTVIDNLMGKANGPL
jgi:hypothetical protein